MNRLIPMGAAGALFACAGPPPPSTGPPSAAVPTTHEPSPSLTLMTPPADPSSTWPVQSGAGWPRRCLLENVAIHPTQPWLAVACTDSEAETGAIMVLDTETGRWRSVTPYAGFVGWSDRGLLQWDPTGARLATNVDTNGIALVDRAEVVGTVFPDEGRDHGVSYVWLGEQIFTSTGSLLAIQRGDSRFDLPTLPNAPRFFGAIALDRRTGLVVGRASGGVAGYDPIAQRLAYAVATPRVDPGVTAWVSPDGRWFLWHRYAIDPAPDELTFLRGDTGEIHATHTASSPRIRKTVWSDDGALAVLSHGNANERYLDVFVEGERRTSIALGAREVQASVSLPETGGIAWAVGHDRVALLVQGQRVEIVDLARGAITSSFVAPAAAIPGKLPRFYTHRHVPDFGFPGDVMWVAPHRLVRIAPHFISVWTPDGTRIAEHVVPE